MSDLTNAQIEDRRQALKQLETELGRLLETTKEGTQVVDLDEPIGRLTRMDAIQQQNVPRPTGAVSIYACGRSHKPWS